MLMVIMDIKQIGSVLLCMTLVFLMPGHALELNADVVHELFTRRMDDVMFENRLLKTKLEEAVREMENQADRISNLEKASNIVEKQAEIAILEDVRNRMDKQAGRITNLEEANNKMQQQADRIMHLEEANIKMKKQADRITNLEESLSNIENRAREGMNIESEMQKLNNRIAKLENTTFNNEKAISYVTRLVTEKKVETIKESEASLNTIQDVVIKQSVTVRKMLSAVKLSFHNKFISFKNGITLQMSAMNTSVESQMSSFETLLKLTENIVSVTLNDYSNGVNETLLSLQKDVNKNERKLETLRQKTDKESDHLNEAYDVIWKLQTRIENVETKQGKRAAFSVRHASLQSNGIVSFSDVHLNERSVYNSATGEFTCPLPGLYVFIANIIEYGSNYISCHIRKNGSGYLNMASVLGIIDHKSATGGTGTASGGVSLHLVTGDRVHVWCYGIAESFLSSSSFTGFLISADP